MTIQGTALGVLGGLLLALAPGCRADTSVADLSSSVGHLEVQGCTIGTIGQATTFAIQNSGETTLLVTVAHVFEDAHSPTVFTSLGAEIPADLIYLDHDLDLALLRVTTSDLQALRTADYNDDDDDDDDIFRIAAFGSPGHAITKPAVVLRTTRLTLDGSQARPALELDAFIENGDSGAPVVNSSGAVVGMIFASKNAIAEATPGDGSTSGGWALASREISVALSSVLSVLSGQAEHAEPIALPC